MTMYKKTMREALEEVASFEIKEEVELDEAKIAKKVPAKDGGYFVVLHRDTKGMRGTQDKFLMRILNKGKVKELGSHPSLDGALKFAKNQGIIEEVELDENVIDKVKKIASEKQAMKIDGVLVDMFTASAISQIYDKVNDANKKKMEKLPIIKLANLAFKMMQKNEFVPEEVELDEWTISDVELAMKKKYGKVDKEAIEKLKKVQYKGNVDRNDLVKVGHGKLHVEEVELDEKTKWKMGDGRPRGGSHIENERFWDLPKSSLEYIIKDAGEAMRLNPTARKATTGRGNWADQVNDAQTVLGWRRKNGIKEEVELDEAKMSSKQIAALKKAYEPMRGGRLSMDNATKLGNLMDRFDKDKDLLIQLFKADIPFVSKIAMTRLISKHKMKGAEINKLADKDEFYRKMYGESLDEDGHTDVASAIRQCKTVMEDAQQIMSKLQTMSPEDSLPTWWTNKFAVASNSMNKMRDYIVNPLGEEVELDEGKMNQLHQLIKDKKSAEEIAKIMKLDVKTIKALMNSYNPEEVELDLEKEKN